MCGDTSRRRRLDGLENDAARLWIFPPWGRVHECPVKVSVELGLPTPRLKIENWIRRFLSHSKALTTLGYRTPLDAKSPREFEGRRNWKDPSSGDPWMRSSSILTYGAAKMDAPGVLWYFSDTADKLFSARPQDVSTTKYFEFYLVIGKAQLFMCTSLGTTSSAHSLKLLEDITTFL
jgi:hypothetical protein